DSERTRESAEEGRVRLGAVPLAELLEEVLRDDRALELVLALDEDVHEDLAEVARELVHLRREAPDLLDAQIAASRAMQEVVTPERVGLGGLAKADGRLLPIVIVVHRCTSNAT